MVFPIINILGINHTINFPQAKYFLVIEIYLSPANGVQEELINRVLNK